VHPLVMATRHSSTESIGLACSPKEHGKRHLSYRSKYRIRANRMLEQTAPHVPLLAAETRVGIVKAIGQIYRPAIQVRI